MTTSVDPVPAVDHHDEEDQLEEVLLAEQRTGALDSSVVQLGVLQTAERGLPPWIALVAYARPADLRLREAALTRAASARELARGGDAVA